MRLQSLKEQYPLGIHPTAPIHPTVPIRRTVPTLLASKRNKSMPVVVLDSGSASSLAVEQASYRLAPLVVVTLDVRESEKSPYCCHLETKKECALDDSDLTAEFRRHVNDYFLREQIAAKTEGVRILLYAQAFSKAITSQ